MSEEKIKYEIPLLPEGYYLDDFSFKIVDYSTVDIEGNYPSKEIRVKFDDNGGGNFAIVSLYNENGNKVSMEFDCESMIKIGEFIKSMAEMIDQSYEKAFKEIDKN